MFSYSISNPASHRTQFLFSAGLIMQFMSEVEGCKLAEWPVRARLFLIVPISPWVPCLHGWVVGVSLGTSWMNKGALGPLDLRLGLSCSCTALGPCISSLLVRRNTKSSPLHLQEISQCSTAGILFYWKRLSKRKRILSFEDLFTTFIYSIAL